jgi:hypothetical protein
MFNKKDVILMEDMTQSQIENDQIVKDIGQRTLTLEREIDGINNLIMDLKKHKLNMESANTLIDSMIKGETDKLKKMKLYGVIKTNVELLTKIYSTIAEFENIKFRYHKEIDDVILNKYRLLKDKINNNNGSIEEFLEKLGNTYVNKKDAVAACQDEVSKDSKYSL